MCSICVCVCIIAWKEFSQHYISDVVVYCNSLRSLSCGKWGLDEDKLLAHILTTQIMLLWGTCGEGKDCQKESLQDKSGRDVFLLHYLHINITMFSKKFSAFFQWSVRQTVASCVSSSYKNRNIKWYKDNIFNLSVFVKDCGKYSTLYGWPLFTVL